jgi:hypothetical protein
MTVKSTPLHSTRAVPPVRSISAIGVRGRREGFSGNVPPLGTGRLEVSLFAIDALVLNTPFQSCLIRYRLGSAVQHQGFSIKDIPNIPPEMGLFL